MYPRFSLIFDIELQKPVTSDGLCPSHGRLPIYGYIFIMIEYDDIVNKTFIQTRRYSFSLFFFLIHSKSCGSLMI